jgi:cation diffusion facilitator CzcD-associated flavoprotein CzcO
VIGSGATAVTLVPAMAKTAAHVTMLQRTPSWYAILPSRDRLANGLRKFLPKEWVYAITRYKNVRFQRYLFRKARKHPDKVAGFLTNQTRKALGPRFDEAAFTPPYKPWEQRLCLVPDGDFFEAINAGKASIVTDRVERFDATGIVLESGRHLKADAIVTATGLNLALAGKIAVSVDGEAVRWDEHFYYRDAMFSNVPNLFAVFGYLNASWTLRVDIVAEYACRLINHMDAIGAQVAVPELPADRALEEENVFDFSSGYIQRSLHKLPKSAKSLPWRLSQDYLSDRRDMQNAGFDDGVLKFSRALRIADPDVALEAAE